MNRKQKESKESGKILHSPPNIYFQLVFSAINQRKWFRLIYSLSPPFLLSYYVLVAVDSERRERVAARKERASLALNAHSWAKHNFMLSNTEECFLPFLGFNSFDVRTNTHAKRAQKTRKSERNNWQKENWRENRRRWNICALNSLVRRATIAASPHQISPPRMQHAKDQQGLNIRQPHVSDVALQRSAFIPSTLLAARTSWIQSSVLKAGARDEGWFKSL